MVPWPVVLFLLTLGPHAFSLEPACLLEFAMVSGDVDPESLVSRTHGELWDSLGGHRINAESFAKILAAKDPFFIPEQEGGELISLRKRMRELENLIRARGWDVEALKPGLLDELRNRQGEAEVAERARRKANNLNESVFTPPFPKESLVLQTPDGSHLVALVSTKTGRRQPAVAQPTLVLDMETRKVTVGETPPIGGAPARFSPDGKSLFVGAGDGVVMKVPFKDGTIHWAEAQTMGTKRDSGEAPDVFVPYANGKKLAVAETHFGFPQFVFDLGTGKRTVVTSGEYFISEIWAWGALPDGKRLWIALTKNGETEVHRVVIDSKGKMVKVGGGIPVASLFLPKNPLWLPDGKSFFNYGQRELYLVEGQEGRATRFIELPEKNLAISEVALHPGGQFAAILLEKANNAGPDTPPARLEWFDLKAKKIVAEHVLPEPRYSGLEFLPDGRINLRTRDGFNRIINIETRLVPK